MLTKLRKICEKYEKIISKMILETWKNMKNTYFPAFSGLAMFNRECLDTLAHELF